jgi:hypothetical protein
LLETESGDSRLQSRSTDNHSNLEITRQTSGSSRIYVSNFLFLVHTYYL